MRMTGNYKHGGRGTRLYGIWKAMRERCMCPNCNRWHRYGGRGIKVCEEWDDFAVFRDWALSHGYSDRLSIDRIDSNGDYEPSNCRWVTQQEQQNNRSNNHRIKVNGEEHTLSEWSRISGIAVSTIYSRLKKGWSEKDAVFARKRINQYC